MPIYVLSHLVIPDEEISFETSGSGGPGGQHVNKTESAVTVIFDVTTSPTLTEFQRKQLLENLASRLTRDGVLRVSARDERSQHRNRALALERFAEILRVALERKKVRRPTRPTRASKRRRLDAKKKRGDVKRGRSGRWRGDD